LTGRATSAVCAVGGILHVPQADPGRGGWKLEQVAGGPLVMIGLARVRG
jgi:hypothetical protein